MRRASRLRLLKSLGGGKEDKAVGGGSLGSSSFVLFRRQTGPFKGFLSSSLRTTSNARDDDDDDDDDVKNPLRRRGAHEEEGVVVGLEIHLQLTSLKTKLFSPASALGVGAGGSASGSPVVHAFDRAEPGTLPSPVNESAVQCALKLATALHATCEKVSEFDRKHYFYGDLPHGYQITQHRKPIITGGRINENVRVERVQLEMDTGKTLSLSSSSGTDTKGDDDVDGDEGEKEISPTKVFSCRLSRRRREKATTTLTFFMIFWSKPPQKVAAAAAF